ncbi:U32 family peptidase [Candidatus Peregrinibacteria bacterium]|nr:U32 family peptidase [Candidatus Peregrinibacteria bacterium]
MAPVGSFAALTAAIEAGANSVYFGVQQLNMRARSAANFTLDDLREIAKTCNDAGVRTYLTVNTVLYDHDLTLMRAIIDTAKEANVTAIIAQDMAAILYANKIGMTIHISTQLSISNYEGVKFYSQFADTIVLAREVDLDSIAAICKKIKEEDLRGPAGELVKIEIFVHGALCIAQSGRCQMSLLQSNTSAQRGACLHECRKKYEVKDMETGHELRIRDNYIMSPKDLCSLPFLDKLIESGVAVLKIEGRGRSPQYVDVVVRVYREARDAIFAKEFTEKKKKEWMKQLGTVYNRGFCDGYYLGKPLPEWSGYSKNRSTDERIFVGRVTHYFPKVGIAEISVDAQKFKKGDHLVIMGNTTGVMYVDVEEVRQDEESSKTVTIPVPDRVRLNDKVYLVTKRNLDELD